MQNLGLGVTISSDVAGAIAGLNNVSQEFERMGAEAVGALRNASTAITDLNSGTVSINRLTQALQVFRTAAFNTTDNEKLKEYNRNISLLEGEIQRLSIAGRSTASTLEQLAAASQRIGVANDTVSQLGKSTQSIQTLSQAINTFRQAVQTSTDPRQIAQYNASIQQLEREMQRLSIAGTQAGERMQLTAIAAGQLANSGANATGKMVLLTQTAQQQARAFDALRYSVQRGTATLGAVGNAATGAGRGMGGAGDAARQAGFQLTSLGRFASDLPFGFIAIQNNIGPLIEGFVSLQRTTGSAGSALAALGKSFIGPAGILVAFQVVSALITTLIQKYGSLGNAVNELNPFISDAERAQNRFNTALNKGGQEAQKEIVHLDLLYRSTQNLNVSASDRVKIAEQLQSQYPGYFKNLTTEEILVGKAANAYQKLRDQIVATAQVKAVEETVAKLAATKFDLATKQLRAEEERTRILNDKSFVGSEARPRQAQRQQEVINSLKADQLSIDKQITQTYADADKIIQKFGKDSLLGSGGSSDDKKVRSLSAIMKDLNKDLQAANDKIKFFGKDSQKISSEKITALNKAFEEISKTGGPGADAQLKSIASQMKVLEGAVTGFKDGDKVAKVLKDLKGELLASDRQAAATGLSFDSLAKEKIVSLQKAFDALIKLGVNPAGSQIKSISDQINSMSERIIGDTPVATKQLQAMGKALQIVRTQTNSIADMQKLFGQSPTGKGSFNDKFSSTGANDDLKNMQVNIKGIDTSIVGASSAWTKFKQNVKNTQVILEQKKFADSVNEFRAVAGQLVADLKTNLIQGFAEGIAGLASGTLTAGGLLGNLLNIVGDFAISLGKAAIPIGVAAQAIRNAFASPQAAIAAGAGLILVGGLIKGFASKLSAGPKMYTGGQVFGPQTVTVGDNPGRHEAIIPSELFGKLGSTPQQVLTAYLAYDRIEYKLEQVRKNKGR